MQIIIKDIKNKETETYLFRDVNISIDSSMKIGLIGNNGSGKTTLLKSIESNNTIYYPLTYDNDENVEEFINRYIMVEQWQILVEFSKLDLNYEILERRMGEMSEGQRRKVMICVLFLSEKFVLLDEITNHLDIKTKKQIITYLNKQSGFIAASHDRSLLNSSVNKIMAISHDTINIYNGNLDIYMHNTEQKRLSDIKQSRVLKKEISRLEQSYKNKQNNANKAEKQKFGVNKNGEKAADRGFLGHKAAKQMKSSKNIEKRVSKQIEEKKTIISEIDEYKQIKLEQVKITHNVIIDDVILFNDKKLDFKINSGEQIYIIGANGSGKTSFLESIIDTFDNLKINYVAQEQSASDITIFDLESDDKQLFYSMLIYLGLNREIFSKKISSLSSGQIKKIYLVLSLINESELILWDEPYNYLDLESKKQINELLIQTNKTMIIVSHEIELLGNRVIEIK